MVHSALSHTLLMDGAFSSISHSTDTNVSNWWLLISATTAASNKGKKYKKRKITVANHSIAQKLSEHRQSPYQSTDYKQLKKDLKAMGAFTNQKTRSLLNIAEAFDALLEQNDASLTH